jgi:hypothetical protein
MLWCYFIARAQAEVETVSYRTLEGRPLSFIRSQELVAAARKLPVRTRSTPELMLEYNAVLLAASRRAAVLPLPFGARFRDEHAVVGLLEERRSELLGALGKLDGKAEMVLRVPLEAGADARALASEVSGIRLPLDTWFAVRFNAAGESLLELAHLIERADADEHRLRFERHRIDVSGPWPPFHFLPRFLRAPVGTERRAGRSGAGRREAAAR